MTVCVAAVADNGKSAVLVADQLTSATMFSWHIESEDPPKIHWLADDKAILTAGDANSTHEIVKIVRGMVTTNQTYDFVELVAFAYSTFRLTKAEQLHLRPRGLTAKQFMEMPAALQGETYRSIERDMANVNLDAVLLAVTLRDGLCTIGTVWHPGIFTRADAAGFACIGDGAAHATYAMLELGYSKDKPLDQVRMMAEQAKVRAEKTKSVGPKTTVATFPRVSGGASGQTSAYPTPA